MQINVVGMLDQLFTSKTTEKNSGVSGRETVIKAAQDTAEIGNRREIIYSRTKEEKKKSGIYEGEAAQENEFASQLAQVKQQLDTMINQMTGDDYATMHADGISITSTDMEHLVTVVEEIKVRLAAYCEDYHPTGDIDREDLEAVLGSAGMAAAVSRKMESYDLPATDENVTEISEAMRQNESLTEVTREQAAYLAMNDLEPTIETVYKVQHSGVAVTDPAQPLSKEDWMQLKPQAEAIIQESGAEVTEETIETAHWMIEHGIPLNKENFTKIGIYTGLNGLKEGEQLDSILSAMAMGKAAKETSLLGESYGTEAVTEVLTQVEKYVEQTYPAEDDSLEAITARRQLEEIRLMMTTEAGISLLKNGVEIDTKDLVTLVEELKRQEQTYYQKMYATEHLEYKEEEADLVKQTEQCRQELSQMPAYLAGAMVVSSEDAPITISTSLETGHQQKAALEAANESYETLMTKPSQEYGDSLKKAFQNVDVLLESMGEEQTEENRRCVRIMAYNQMAITRANFNQIQALDREYQYLLTNLTPRVAMHMVKKRINPLNTEIHDLNDQIEEIKQEIGPSEDEKYSEFLWKLEQKTEIPKEEHAAYIGIYRLLNTVNRQDSAALGALVAQGADVTLENLLSASRSRKARNMDVKVEDSFGLVQSVLKGNSITDQLKLFYENSSEENRAYQQQMAENLRELRADKKAQQLLAESEQNISPDTLKAAGMLVGQTDKELKKYWERQKKQGRLEEFLRQMTGKDSLTSVYEDTEEELSKELAEECTQGTISFDGLEELRLYYHTSQLMTNLSRQEEYHIPLEYQGEITDIHLKVIHKKEGSGTVSVETQLPELGKIMAEFSLKEGMVNGYVLGESVRAVKAIYGQTDKMKQIFSASGIKTGEIVCQTSDSLPILSSKKETAEETTNAQLYDVAKGFLVALKNLEHTI